MAAWHRCPKSTFYRRAGLVKRFDKFDRAYVDPIDLVMIHTIPGDNGVNVLRWQLNAFNEDTFSGFGSKETSILAGWAMRVESEMQDETEETWGRRKQALLGDLDVDAEARDRLLDAVERWVFGGPEADTSFQEKKVPQNDEAVKGVLFHFGVGPC